MKKVWFTSVILSGAMAAGLYAQQSTTASSSSNDHVTVQGCVERASLSGTTGTTGTTGSTATTGSTTTTGSTAGSSMAGGQFVLTNVSNSNSASTTAGTTGSTTASSSSTLPTATEYRLDDNGQNRLASYVGQKVEVSGTVDNRESSAGSASSGTTGSTASGTTGSTASSQQSASANDNAPKLKVDSIRMIASSCSAR